MPSTEFYFPGPLFNQVTSETLVKVSRAILPTNKPVAFNLGDNHKNYFKAMEMTSYLQRLTFAESLCPEIKNIVMTNPKASRLSLCSLCCHLG